MTKNQGFRENIFSEMHNIWRYGFYYPEELGNRDQLYIDDKFSPIEKCDEVGIENILLKREDKNITGSLKSRGLAYQLSVAIAKGCNKFVLSTSGNAGITASKFVEKYGGELIVVTSDTIPKRKITALRNCCQNVLIAKNPMHMANMIAMKYGYKNIRPSRDSNSIPGYYSLAFEMFEQMKNCPDNVFIYSTSGSSFIGIYEGFKILKEHKEVDKIPSMYAVRVLNRTTFRGKKIEEICKETGGKIVTITKDEFDSIDFDTSFEGRSTLFATQSMSPEGRTVAVLTGSRYKDHDTMNRELFYVDSPEDIDKYMKLIECKNE